ncbi:hypothetical protein [Streptomyces sp. STCH 565 A]|uniref:hypothetical protein n=1 Tax=Streptomyces sp. STCH 565 A TaxID=2950532 RepID=UPI0020754732|nr:hypothetical protein [Streptomyces sp. STCH 565 A]MCM8548934.1 hypothetical protein [Streptomyces sp. STCH 565 A]
MRSPRRYQHAATGGAVLLTAACVNALVHDEEIPAILFGLGVLVLTEAALREHRHLRRQRLEHDWARRRALGHNPAPLTPCCLLARASHDQAHDRNCTSEHSLERFIAQIESEHRNDS